jgi:uncharacterized protein (DUF1330 family)
MAKGYWITMYHSINDQAKMEAYRDMAGPLLIAKGGKFIVRGIPAQSYEKGIMERVVMIEFESVEKAIFAHDSPEYQEALKVLGNGADRDIRIVEGIEI